jgi:hypothetical protein
MEGIMSQEKLKQANQLIKNKEYEQAHSLLSTIKGNSTADKWLKKLEDMGYGVQETYSFLDDGLDSEVDLHSLFDERPSSVISAKESSTSQSKINIESHPPVIELDDPNEDENEYALVKFIASLYKFFGVLMIGLGFAIGGYLVFGNGFWDELSVSIIPLIFGGIGLLFACEAIIMFHELVMNSRKQRDLLRTIARRLR